MKKRRRFILIGILIVILALAGTAAVLYGSVITSMLSVLGGDQKTATSAVMSETVSVQRGDLEDVVRVLGSVTAPTRISLTFNSDWGQVAETPVKAGAVVKAGDLIASLDVTKLRKQVETAQKALQRAQADLEKAKQPLTPLTMAQKRLSVQLAQTKVDEETAALKKAQTVDLGKLKTDAAAARQKLADARLAYAQLKMKDVSLETAPLEERYAPAANKCAELAAKTAPNFLDNDLRWAVCNEATDGGDEIFRIRQAHERSLLTGAYDITRAERALAKAEQALANSDPDPLTVAQAENALAEAQAKLIAAQEELKAAEAGSTEEIVADRTAAVQNAQRALEELQTELAHATLHAPMAGTVTRVGVAVGDWVDRSAVAAEIADLTNLRILADVDETEIRKFVVGQPVRVSFDALAGQKFEGRVELIPIQGALSNDVLMFRVPVQLVDAWPAGLRLGMTASMEVVTQSVRDVLFAPAAAIQELPDGKAVTLLVGASTERRYVKTGRSNGVYTEITDGLQEGDQVEVYYGETEAQTTNG